MSKRVMKRSYSSPGDKSSFSIDPALATGFQHSRTSLAVPLPNLTEDERDAEVLREKLEANPQLFLSFLVEHKALKEKLQAQTELATFFRDKCNRSEDELKAVKEKLKDVKNRKDIDPKVHVREALTEFKIMGGRLNRALMSEVYNQFPGVFPNGFYSFTTMICFLTEQQRFGKSEMNIENQLGCLLKVAVDFKSPPWRWWKKDKAEQFFHLCRIVPLWNSDTFHPQIRGGVLRPIIMNNASNGLYKIDINKGGFSKEGMDLGPLILELIHLR